MIGQQGDVLWKCIGIHGVFEKEFSSIPKEAKPTGSNLVLKGANNSHALYGGKFTILEHDGITFLDVLEETTIDHVKDIQTMARAEHHAQTIKPGQYFIDQVNEFDHLLEESRKIID
jgi:hypothetical protein